MVPVATGRTSDQPVTITGQLAITGQAAISQPGTGTGLVLRELLNHNSLFIFLIIKKASGPKA